MKNGLVIADSSPIISLVLVDKLWILDFLLIDDKKARKIAENFGIKCVGTLGLLSVAKDQGFIENLRPIFQNFISNNRFYSQDLLNKILKLKEEPPL